MDSLESRATRRLLIAFIDITGYTQFAERCADEQVAELMDQYYERVGELAARAGGRLVKPIGDGALVVFAPERADDAVDALLQLREDIAAMCAAVSWTATLVVRVHAGDVVCG